MFNFVISNTYSTPMTDGYYDGYAIVNTSATKLLGLIAENADDGYTAWIQVHDGYEVPTAGSVPVLSIKLLKEIQTFIDLSTLHGLDLVNGCVVTVSSTGPSYTAVTGSASAGMFLTAFWI